MTCHLRYWMLVLGAFVWACQFGSPAFAQSSTADKMEQQALALQNEGLYDQAIEPAREALALYTRTLGSDHPNVAMALNILSGLYLRQGRLPDAESFAKQAVDIFKRTVGPKDPNLGTALSQLAWVYVQEQRDRDAEPLFRQALDILEHGLGPNDLMVAAAVGALASLYDRETRYSDAEPLYKRVLAIDETLFGPDSPEIVKDLISLALVYSNEGRLGDSDRLYERSLAIREKAFGAADLRVSELLQSLGSQYSMEGRFIDAERLLKRSLSIREQALGSDHSDVASTLIDLGNMYNNRSRFVDAEAAFKRALAIKERQPGGDRAQLMTCLFGLAVSYIRRERYDEGDALLKRSLAIADKSQEGGNLGMTMSLFGLALIYREQGRYDEAEPLLKLSLTNLGRVYGDGFPVATASTGLGMLYFSEGRYGDAEALFKRSLAINERIFGNTSSEVAKSLNNLALVYDNQGRYAEAKPLYDRALQIDKSVFGPTHPETGTALNNLALLYLHQKRYAQARPLFEQSLRIREKALPRGHSQLSMVMDSLANVYFNEGKSRKAWDLVERTMKEGTAGTWSALPVLFDGQRKGLAPAAVALDKALTVVQRAQRTAAGDSLNALGARFAASNNRLAELVRKDQDLAADIAALDRAIMSEIVKEPGKRDIAAEQDMRDRMAAAVRERGALGKVLAGEFPDYAALSAPEPLSIEQIRPLLAEDEALVVVDIYEKGYVWAITRDGAQWKELGGIAEEVGNRVAALRRLLNFHSVRPFDAQASFALYKMLLAPVEDVLREKPRLSLVLNGALTSLPPQLLVTRDPTGKALRDVDWLVRSHAVTVLPSIASLKVLRGKSVLAGAPKPLIGFADPVFARNLQQNARVAANVTVARGLRSPVADVAELRTALSRLPETATELREVAASVHADAADVILGDDATETRVKQEKLDQYRIVYFATHGLLAGEVADFAKLNAEPALVLTLPEKVTDLDDGLLTASEVAQLKLNADWVVLSACNTAAAEKPGAEALSGLARAFFYAGGRSLLVSNWEVDTKSAVALMTGTFAALTADPKLSHAQALQKSMLAMIDDPQHPQWADPKYWAPFVVVGEPAKPSN